MLSVFAKNTLFQLATTVNQMRLSQNRLSSGSRFSTSIMDNASTRLEAENYQKQISEFLNYKEGMDEGSSVVNGAIAGVTSSKSMLTELKSVAIDVGNGSIDDATAQLKAEEILVQYDGIISDSDVNNTNLINGTLTNGSDETVYPSYDVNSWIDISAEVGVDSFTAKSFFEHEDKLLVIGSDATNQYHMLSYDGETWTKAEGSVAPLSTLSSFEEHSGNLIFKGYNGDLAFYDGTTFSNITAETGVRAYDTSTIYERENGDLLITAPSDDPYDDTLLVYNGTTWTSINTDIRNIEFIEKGGEVLIEGIGRRGGFGGGSSPKLYKLEGNTLTLLSNEYKGYDLGDKLLFTKKIGFGTNKLLVHDWSTGTDTDITEQTGSSSFYVNKMQEYNGKLLIGGYDGLLEYDGTTFKNLTSDTGYGSHEFYEYNGELLIRGYDSSTGNRKLLTYDGTTITDLTEQIGIDSFYISKTQEYNGELLIEGSNKLLTYDGTTLTDITADTGLTSFYISRTQEYNGEILINGYDPSNSSVRKFLTYDGTTLTDITAADTGIDSLSISGTPQEYNGELLINAYDSSTGNYKLLTYDGTTLTDITAADTGLTSFRISKTQEYNGKLLINAYDPSNSSVSKLLTYDGTTIADITADTGMESFRISKTQEYNGKLLINAYDPSNSSVRKLLTYDGTTITDITAETGTDSFYISKTQEYNGKLLINGYDPSNSSVRKLFTYNGENLLDINADLDTSNINNFYEFNDELFVSIEDSSSNIKFLKYEEDPDFEAPPNLIGSYDVVFSKDAEYDVKALDLRADSIGINIEKLDFSLENINDTISKIDSAIHQIEGYAKSLTTTKDLIKTRLDFTSEISGSYQKLYNDLTIVDANEESAKLKSFQVQQQMMMNVLSFTINSQSQINSIFSGVSFF